MFWIPTNIADRGIDEIASRYLSAPASQDKKQNLEARIRHDWDRRSDNFYLYNYLGDGSEVSPGSPILVGTARKKLAYWLIRAGIFVGMPLRISKFSWSAQQISGDLPDHQTCTYSTVRSTTFPTNNALFNKLPPELRCRNFATKHRLSIKIGAKCGKTCVQRVCIPTELPFCMPALVVGFSFPTFLPPCTQ